MTFYPRWQTQCIQHAIHTRRVLLLNGARQSGKTTLAKQIAGTASLYRTLDDLAIRQMAQLDPHGFVKHAEKILIIDEVQRAPDLLSAIKLVVDEDTRPGQFLLTGSANIRSLPGVQESLAGRIRKIRLRGLTQGELVGSPPSFLDLACEQRFSSAKSTIDRQKALEFAMQGGFPEAIALPAKDRREWHRDYLAALLERDLLDIAHITRHHAMQALIHTLAAWSGKLMDVSAIGSGLSIRRPTIETYTNALEALYLIDRVQPWTHTDYERVGKQTKLYMTDTGLMASILNWHLNQIELDADRSGKLIESWIYNELAALVDAGDGKYQLFHYRDREKREIDFLIENENGTLLGIEVKAGSSISTTDFKHLRWFKDHLAKDRPFIGIVLYGGDYAGSMGNDLWAVPFGGMFEAK